MWRGLRKIHLASKEGRLGIEPRLNLVEMQEKPKLGVEGVVVFLMLQFF